MSLLIYSTILKYILNINIVINKIILINLMGLYQYIYNLYLIEIFNSLSLLFLSIMAVFL